MARVYMYAENATEARRCAMVVIDAHKNRNVFPWADKNDVLNEKKEIRDRTFSSEHLFALNIKKLTDYIEGYFMVNKRTSVDTCFFGNFICSW